MLSDIGINIHLHNFFAPDRGGERSMNLKGRAVISTLSAIAAVAFSASAAVEAPFEVGTWANFCDGAVSHTFDDNKNTNPTGEGQQIYDEKKFHMTLCVQTNSVNWENCKASFAKGHEISSHTTDHYTSDAAARDSRSAIRENVPGEQCVTIAYPDCQQRGVNILQYYLAGRNCSGQLNSTTPGQWDQINSKMFGSGNGGNCNTADCLNEYANNAATANGWSVYCFHGIGSDWHDYATIDINAMKDHLDYLDENRDKIWIETFGSVTRYIKERDAANIEVESSTDDSIVISVTDDLPDSIFNYPLTIRRPVPEGWATIIVTQGDFDTEDSVVTQDGEEYVMFKAIPDSDNVVITRITTGSRTVGHTGKLNGVAPVTFNRSSTLTIDRNYFNGSNLSVAFFDLTGKVIARYTLGADENSVALPTSQISRSACIVKIAGKGVTYTGKFMPQL